MMTFSFIPKILVVPLLTLAACFVAPSVVAESAADAVEIKPYSLVIPAPLDGGKGKNPYIETLLTDIFKAQGYTLDIQYSKQPTNKIRAAKLVSQNQQMDLLWAIATKDKEQQLRSIRFPIYRGYIGWRVLLTKRGHGERFAEIKTIKQLQNFIGVQKYDWLDYKILQSNGLNIVTDMAFSAMFKAVETGLVDYFPRSVLEVEKELSQFGQGKLAIEEKLLIHYPSASYFYVSKDNQSLAKILDSGFEQIIKNGTYQAHFQQHFGSTIKHLKLSERQVIQLNNPYF